MKLERAKSWENKESATEGSLWEICLFAIFFVLIFSAVARAEDVADDTAVASTVSTPAAGAPAETASSEIKSEVNVANSDDNEAVLASRTARVSAPDVAKALPFMRFVVSTARTIQDDEPVSYSGSYDLTLINRSLFPGYVLSARLIYGREYSYETNDANDGAFANPSASISKTFTRGVHYSEAAFLDSYAFGVSGSLPGNREAQRRTFQGAIGPTFRMTKKAGRFDILELLSYSRQFYGYDIRDDGTVNSPDLYKSLTEIGYNVTEKLSLSIGVGLSMAQNFQGTWTTSELSAVSADYGFSQNMTASLGLSTERGTQESEGQYDRVRVFAPEVAQAFLDLALSF